MQKITPHLWYDSNAEEAVAFYSSVFKGGKIHEITRYTEAGFEIHGMPAGTVMTVSFEIEGYEFLAINAGPIFKFTPAISFMVHCASHEEVNELYGKLAEGGKPLMPLDTYPFSERYGWIQDKYGVTWQIIHTKESFTQKIVPSLMYVGDVAGKAEEAITFYTSIFKNSKIGEVARYGADAAPDKEGTLMYSDFYLEGQKFAAMDSAQAHEFTFTEAISLLVACEDQEEIDYLWDKMSAVKEAEQCGWIKDKYGVSWQIAPKGMGEMLNNPDRAKANKAMDAMMQMKKIDITKLKEAAEG